MNTHVYKQFKIEVFDDAAYAFDSVDNENQYDKIYSSDGAEKFPVSKHGIKIFKDEREISSCLVAASAGATGIDENSSLVDADKLLVCCCDTVFCLLLPTLDLEWRTKADDATCFRIYKFQNTYLIHGELDITRIDANGKILWQFGGADIFVSADGNGKFEINADYISVSDWNESEYKIGFDGKLLEYKNG